MIIEYNGVSGHIEVGNKSVGFLSNDCDAYNKVLLQHRPAWVLQVVKGWTAVPGLYTQQPTARELNKMLDAMKRRFPMFDIYVHTWGTHEGPVLRVTGLTEIEMQEIEQRKALLAQRGFGMMKRGRNGDYWLVSKEPMKLDEIDRFVNFTADRVRGVA
jgi:hypothetical protein